MKTRFATVRFRILAGLFALVILSTVLSYVLIFNAQRTSTVNSRMSEIGRYASLVASNITQNKYVSGSEDRYYEVDSMAAFYPEARILVLNDMCRVVKDSSNTRRGRTFVNDSILAALAGVSGSHIEGMYGVIAVPVSDYRTSEVDGVVYVSLSLEAQYKKTASSMDSIMTTLVVSGILMMIVLALLINIGFRPLSEITRWLKEVEKGHGENPPLVRDQSEYGQMVKSVTSLMQDLKALDETRQEFVSNVSHELKTPLSSMKVLAESLLQEEDVDAATYREFLGDINAELDRESSLVNDLLKLVRLESGQSMNFKMVSMNELCEIILNRLRPLAEQKEVELILENISRVEAEIDEPTLTVAITNLVENAIKYNKDGGSVRVTLDADFADAILSVTDTGCGIPQEDFNKIFQRFYRVDKARERAAGGTGLGLAIVQQIITMHHGSIHVRSKVDLGTCFTIRIPLIAIRQPSMTEESPI